MKSCLLICLFAILVIGCAGGNGNAFVPDTSSDPVSMDSNSTTPGRDVSLLNPHKLWAAGNLILDADRGEVELVPLRFGGIHLNVLKFFETSCDYCLQITNFYNNGDGTYGLTIQIKHPFPNHKELTVFDPKLILMFRGSHQIPAYRYYPPYPSDSFLSWRILGDPEVMNPDGYTYFWSPWYDSGSDLDIFKFWKGKYAFGDPPTANINAYLDYYSNEERHMLESGEIVSHTFILSLPAGITTAGYALDVCWEIPNVMPVINPADDFPITANQPELYHFNVVYNNNEVIKENCCWLDINDGYVEFNYWYKLPKALENCYAVGSWCEAFAIQAGGYCIDECNSPDPDHLRCATGFWFYDVPDGFYQVLAFEYHENFGLPGFAPYPSVDVFEVEIDYN
ncbi:MAG: hypothetical protein NTY09_07865 [bacterium]|nr:hypothetical protein [bacterium]